MCFSYGRVGHKVDGCPYTTRASEKESRKQPGEDTTGQKDSHTPSDETYGPWVLVSRKKQTIRRTRKESTQLSPFGPDNTAKERPIAQATNHLLLGLPHRALERRMQKVFLMVSLMVVRLLHIALSL